MTAPMVIIGATGFLGWHVRVLARALALPDPVLVSRRDLADRDRLGALLDGADRVLHLAGVSRGEPDEVEAGNVALARAVVEGLRRCGTPPKSLGFANSVQAGNGTPYGDSKAAAAALLAETTRWTGSFFDDVRLPNLFGEHGRPHYNSAVATFCRVLADGGTPVVDQDRELDLLHATDAAMLLLGGDEATPARRTVAQVAAQLRRFATQYRTGDIPELAGRFEVQLFNTYRSHCPPAPIPLARHADARGELVEAVRVHGGGGQAFLSSTHPGVTRGAHFHLSKVERFVVVRGEAEIRLRRLFHDDVVRLRVSGSDPAAVDMPAMWAHDITNVGAGELLTIFWANELFDPQRPDTHPEAVAP